MSTHRHHPLPLTCSESHPEHLQARGVLTQLSQPEPPPEIMWMPGGISTIHASRGGKKVVAQIQVDALTAATARAALQRHLAAGGPKPFFDFDHLGLAASAWPKDFLWRETPEPGVYAVVEWSEAGASAIRGKTHQGFSPCCFDEVVPAGTPARVLGLPLNMGGLVNDPAFKRNRLLFAKRNGTEMNKTKLMALLAALAGLQSERTALAGKTAEADVQALQAKDAEFATKLKEASDLLAEETDGNGDGDGDAGELRAKVATLEADLRARNTQNADTAVQAAVARGAIAAKDTATQQQWRDAILLDPKAAQLLAKIPGAPALQGSSRITTGDDGRRVDVVRIDCNDALRGYLEASTPRARGLVYQRELHPRLVGGEIIPFDRVDAQVLKGANTLGALVGDIISQRTLSLVFTKRPALKGLITDLSDEKVALNQLVKVRKIGLPSVADFGSAASDTSDTDVSVTLGSHKQVLFTYTAAEYNGTSRNLVEEHAGAMAAALGNHLVDAVAALITDAFTAEATGAGSTKDYTSLTATVNALNAAGVPDVRRFGWVNSDVAEALRNDDVVMRNLDPQNTSAYAVWKNVLGFESIWEYPSLPGNSVNLIAFFGMADALALASRVVVDPSAILGVGYPGKINTIMDPVSGLAVVQNQWIGQSDLAINDRLIVAYGVARGNVTCGYKWVTS